MNKIIAFIVLLTLSMSSPVFGQNIFKSNDLKAVVVDDLSDDQIRQIQSQLVANGSTIESVEPMAISKGMSKGEFDKLKLRLSKLQTQGNTTSSSSDVARKQKVSDEDAAKPDGDGTPAIDPLIFGSELFSNPTLNFAPDYKLATPLNYVLGPGDEMQISVYGVQEFNASLPVSVEGKLSIPYVGQISVAGMTIEAATQKIKASLSKVYSTVSSGQSTVSVSLGTIRTIRVTIIGSRQPGNYSISSLASVYNALHLAGGPADNGSYRNIQLIRGNKVYKNIDIYRFLVNGDKSDDVGLKDNDVIKIPVYKKRVILEGEVKRPGIFEMKGEETFSDLLSFASGFSDVAYTASVNVVQKTDKEYKVSDIYASEYLTYKPHAGDVYKVSKILSRFENRVTIEGAVFRPNQFSFTAGMKVSDLIKKADGLREDAYTQRGRIVRQRPDLTSEIVEVNIGKAISGDAESDIELKREDVLTVYSLLDFKENYSITINGEIKNPGVYPFVEQLSLNDLLVEAGGLTGAASKKVEIARMIKSEDIKVNSQKVELLNIEIDAMSNEQLDNIKLKPFDVVNIRKLPVYEQPETIMVSGSVIYPGKYVLANKDERIADVIKRAGGLNPQANTEGVKIKRPIKSDQLEDLNRIDLNLGKGDTIQDKLTQKVAELRYATIPVDWRQIAKNERHYSNVLLQPGDEIEVSAFTEAVKISGNVLLTSEIPYRKGKGFNYYINSVGGVDAKGWKRKSYIIYPNGRAETAGSFLFFKSYPTIEPGSQIVVPAKPEGRKLSTGEIVGIAGILTSLAGVVIAILR
ncbi:SLBB domain-containing protein [Flavobacterium sp. DG1-102-2]|uniref:SLBB domain-containing protein n=1 Tax=Flavobacterium sp. DG1-102-2 TaxID=3081663 RepID=UPI0029496539|nr:SLBB domain-containing protein [Flavobacterium sp. DG1-102-2]MDV6168372.1 SLBB domain-containing protein [Flavobacterium sp. DG1-102-2]